MTSRASFAKAFVEWNLYFLPVTVQLGFEDIRKTERAPPCSASPAAFYKLPSRGSRAARFCPCSFPFPQPGPVAESQQTWALRTCFIFTGLQNTGSEPDLIQSWTRCSLEVKATLAVGFAHRERGSGLLTLLCVFLPHLIASPYQAK